jgi:hypothetical protein
MRPDQKGASKIPPKRESQRELNAPLERSVPVPTRIHLDIRFWPGPDGSIGASHRAIGPVDLSGNMTVALPLVHQRNSCPYSPSSREMSLMFCSVVHRTDAGS